MKSPKNKKPYWFITVFEKLEISKPGLFQSGSGIAKLGDYIRHNTSIKQRKKVFL